MGFEPRFIELAGVVNGAMPHQVVTKLVEALNSSRKSINGSHILVAGIAYKRDIDDIRESPALDVMGLLHEAGARVSYADPYVPRLAASQWPGRYDLESQPLTPATLSGIDCVAILTDHRSVDYNYLASIAPLIVDTRNAVPTRHSHVFRLGAPSSVAEAMPDLVSQ